MIFLECIGSRASLSAPEAKAELQVRLFTYMYPLGNVVFGGGHVRKKYGGRSLPDFCEEVQGPPRRAGGEKADEIRLILLSVRQ